MDILKVDGFRLLNHLHTTVRQLEICSQILLELGSTQKIKTSLYESLLKWSVQNENRDVKYSNSKGKLTHNNKPTTAFNHYIDLCKSLGLVNDLNNVYANSRLSHILIHFLSIDDSRIEVNKAEKYYYLYLLLMKDADGIFLVLTILANSENNQQSLLRRFRDALNERLLIKQNLASNYVKSVISEKYRAVNYIWKKPEKYAEHLLIPRCEWLHQLDIISINNQKGSTIYALTPTGVLFVRLLPRLSGTSIIDINEQWMNDQIFTIFAETFITSKLSVFQYNEQFLSQLGNSLETAVNIIKSSNLFRIPSFDSLLFICMNMLVNYQIVINFSDIIKVLDTGLNYNGKQYLIKNTGRINESYITTRPL